MSRAPHLAEVLLWRRLDAPGHEAVHLHFDAGTWRLRGTAVFAHGPTPCRLDYEVVCDARWRTERARIAGWLGTRAFAVSVRAGARAGWTAGAGPCPGLDGCIDLDLGFSPATNPCRSGAWGSPTASTPRSARPGCAFRSSPSSPWSRATRARAPRATATRATAQASPPPSRSTAPGW